MTSKEFVNEYNKKWTNEYNLVSNESLKSSWYQLAEAFNECIQLNNWNEGNNKRLVVPMPTGSGKTTGLQLYLENLDKNNTALIVVYFTDEADKLEKALNEKTPNKAIAVHSKNNHTISDIKEHQVLIVTHQHFKKRMFECHLDRNLIVIDEAIDLMHEVCIKMYDLSKIETLIQSRPYTNNIIKEDLKTIQAFKGIIENYCYQYENLVSDAKNRGIDASVVKNEFLVSDSDITSFNFDNTRSLIKNNSCSGILTGNNYIQEKEQEFKQKLLNTIDDIELLFGSWHYYYGTSSDTGSLNKASIELPNKSVVILDATASTNHLYSLFKDVKVYSTDISARNYSNCFLHIASGINTGKNSMVGSNSEDNTKKEISAKVLMYNLVDIPEINKESKVLIVTHKDLEAFIEKYELDCDYTTAHFGNLTGKNDWQDYDTVIIYGLMHKPKQYIINRHAVAVSPDNAIGQINQLDKNTRKSIENTDLASEVIQAINRVRCRQTIDDKGNCDTTNIYLTLPSNRETSRIIREEIISKMPNINVKEWNFVPEELVRTSSKKSSYHDIVLKYIVNEISNHDEFLETKIVKDSLNISSSSTFNDLIRKKAFINDLKSYNIEVMKHPRDARKNVFIKK